MKVDWDMAARRILEGERALAKYNKPSTLPIFVEWRKIINIGTLQIIAPNISREIVLLSTPTISQGDNPIGSQEELITSLKKFDPIREYLYADDELELDGKRQNLLRRVENKLVRLTDEQTEYMIRNPPNVIEVG